MASFRASLRVAQPMRAGLRATQAPAMARIASPSVRFYASGPTPGSHPPPSDSANKGTSKMLFASVALLAAGAGAFLLLGDDKKSTLGVGKGTDVSKVSGAKARVAKSAGLAGDGTGLGTSFSDYQEVYNAIADKLDNEEYDDGSYGPVLVRLAWHASGTYDKKSGTGGSNGATMRFAPESDHGANAGLIHARNFMDEIKKQFPWISYSDLWTLGGVVAVQELGGPKIPWRPGRSDKEAANCTPDGRLPDADKGSSHLRDIFYRMGFNDADIVALSGAHSLGRCHPDRSGFDGPWQHSPTSFNNEYFRLLIEEKWQQRKWDGPMQYEDVSTKSLMMLPTDMALVKDSKFKPYVEKFAKDEGAFFDAFAKVYSQLLELGVQETNWKAGLKILPDGKPLVFKTVDEQDK